MRQEGEARKTAKGGWAGAAMRVTELERSKGEHEQFGRRLGTDLKKGGKKKSLDVCPWRPGPGA